MCSKVVEDHWKWTLTGSFEWMTLKILRTNSSTLRILSKCFSLCWQTRRTHNRKKLFLENKLLSFSNHKNVTCPEISDCENKALPNSKHVGQFKKWWVDKDGKRIFFEEAGKPNNGLTLFPNLGWPETYVTTFKIGPQFREKIRR